MTPSDSNPVAGGPRGPLAEIATPAILRWVGCGFLLLSVLDLLESLIPAQLMNPSWEMQFMGTLVERSPVPVLGFILVFYGDAAGRKRWGLWAARGLSWAALVLGIGFLLMTPLILTNTFRIEEQGTARINLQASQQLSQAERIEKALGEAGPQELEAMLKRLGRASEGKTATDLRGELLGELTQAKQSIQSRADETRSAQQLNLVKKSSKWGGQALIVGMLLVYLWHATQWARRGRVVAKG